MIYNEDAPGLETSLHNTFRDLGIEAKWTMAAEAREYRETLAIEKAMREQSNHN